MLNELLTSVYGVTQLTVIDHDLDRHSRDATICMW